MLEEKTVYFEKFDEEKNTVKVLELVREYAEKNNIRSIVIASTRGFVAEKALEILDPERFNIIIVTHVSWFREGVKQEFNEDLHSNLIERGVKVITAAHALGGICSAVDKKYGGLSPGGLIANVLRTFCEGMKVAVEIALMATDAGYVKPGEDVIAVAGTGRGADTAVLITATVSRRFFDLRVKKILAKPIY